MEFKFGKNVLLEKFKKYPNAFLVLLDGKEIGHIACCGRFGNWTWSLNTETLDVTSNFSMFRKKELAAKKLFLEYQRRVSTVQSLVCGKSGLSSSIINK